MSHFVLEENYLLTLSHRELSYMPTARFGDKSFVCDEIRQPAVGVHWLAPLAWISQRRNRSCCSPIKQIIQVHVNGPVDLLQLVRYNHFH